MQNNHNPFSMDDAIRFAGTPAGKQLLNLLKSGNPADINAARKAVEAGDYEQAKKNLSFLLQSPDVQKLLKEMEQAHE